MPSTQKVMTPCHFLCEVICDFTQVRSLTGSTITQTNLWAFLGGSFWTGFSELGGLPLIKGNWMKRRKWAENQRSFLSAPWLWAHRGQDTTQAPAAVTYPSWWTALWRCKPNLSQLSFPLPPPSFSLSFPLPLPPFPPPSCPPFLSFFSQEGCPHSEKSDTHTSTPTLGWILNSAMIFIFILYGLVSYVSVECVLVSISLFPPQTLKTGHGS